MADKHLTPEPVENPDRLSAMTLTRKVGQSIHIGENIILTITAIDIRSKTARIRIAAPRSTAVNRGEIVANVARGNLVAATDQTSDAEFLIEL